MEHALRFATSKFCDELMHCAHLLPVRLHFAFVYLDREVGLLHMLILRKSVKNDWKKRSGEPQSFCSALGVGSGMCSAGREGARDGT